MIVDGQTLVQIASQLALVLLIVSMVLAFIRLVRGPQAADRVVAQIGITRRLGADGFTIFNLSRNTAETILPGLALSATATEATPPHRGGSGSARELPR